jgi:hypothetical protein
MSVCFNNLSNGGTEGRTSKDVLGRMCVRIHESRNDDTIMVINYIALIEFVGIFSGIKVGVASCDKRNGSSDNIHTH